MPAPRPPVTPAWLEELFAGYMGLLLGLGLLKFGNPVILDRLIEPPADVYEILLQPWPVAWGIALLMPAVALFFLARPRKPEMPRWVIGLSSAWLGWQFVAATQTVDGWLTKITLTHFTACLVCFYLGLCGLSQVRRQKTFWLGPLAGGIAVLVIGLNQHFGGLEETRRFIYAQPDWRNLPPDFLAKIASNRIFSTLAYPNALAGVILLLLPMMLRGIWQFSGRLQLATRVLLVGLTAAAGLACLYWSGSKAGWLIGLLLGMVALFHLNFSRKLKLASAGVLLVVGLASFLIKYEAYFKKGATSAGARFDYWRAAVQIVIEHPLLGTGPGTFQIPYRKIKPPSSEMARLVHNDYLEQASDSGVIGFSTFFIFICASIVYLYRKCSFKYGWETFSIWLGLLGWSLQGLVEFGLYIPALAWISFALQGWLWGQKTVGNEFDNLKRSR